MDFTLVPDNEVERLKYLASMGLLDSISESQFESVTHIAKTVFDVETVAVSLVKQDCLRFHSSLNTISCEVKRSQSFCTHVVYEAKPMVIEDASKDRRFTSNPYVNGEIEEYRFYAGVPVIVGDNLVIGTLCIIDKSPRTFNKKELGILESLAKQVTNILEAHEFKRTLEQRESAHAHALARFSALFNHAAAGILRIDHRGQIKAVNPLALQLLGYTEEELLGNNVSMLMPAQWSSEHDQYLSSYINGRQPSVIGQGRQVLALHKNGKEIPVHLAVSEVRVEGDEFPEFIGILSDLTALTEAEKREQHERALMKSIIDASSDPIFVKDLEGNYLIANNASMEFVGVSEQHIKDYNTQTILSEDELQSILRTEQKVIDTKKPHKIRVELNNGVIFDVTKSPIIADDGTLTGIVNVAHDISELVESNKAKESQQHLLGVLHKGLTDYQALMSGNDLWDFLKEALRELTNSDYALIGEVVQHQNSPALKIHAITDLSWSESSKQLMEQLRAGDMLLTNQETLLGRVFAKGEVVLTNDFGNEVGRGGFPPGHPPLHNYLGVPIFDGSALIGMFAIANSKHRYSNETIQRLEPFTATCALLINLYRQMAERERFTEELKQARDEQAAASRAKTDFLSSMSHELRTPLNSILGFSQLLLNSKRHPLNEKQHKQVMQIHKSGHHLLTLINEVLDLARIESGWISLSMEEAVLLDVVSEAYDTVANIAHEEGISLMPLPLELHEYSVTADFTRLKQVLINLLSNAIKYNSEQGKVEVILKVSDEMVEIGVRDTGIGIPDEYIEDIFEPFNRLDADKTLIEGTGVGLALTKKLVELMEGTIRVESIPKTGTTFWVSLKRASTNKPMHVDNEPADLSFSAVNTRSKLLYIEDNPANQRLMADIMEDYPTIDLTLAHDAVFGIDIAKAEHPDLIILDINLPGMDGIKACKLLKEDPVTASIPIIALSANAMKSDINKGLDAGFDEYLTKPIDVGELLNTLTRYLDNMD